MMNEIFRGFPQILQEDYLTELQFQFTNVPLSYHPTRLNVAAKSSVK
jgi:hypothetical protein